MTPEEIAKLQQFSPESYLADLIREAVRNAYEDAARIADDWYKVSADARDAWVGPAIAASIRERGRKA